MGGENNVRLVTKNEVMHLYKSTNFESDLFTVLKTKDNRYNSVELLGGNGT